MLRAASVSRPSVDVDALIEEVRRDADRLRAEIGPAVTKTAELPGASIKMEPSRPGPRLDQLRGLANPRGGPVLSHRGLLGKPILALKRVLIRLLTPIWDQQTQFGEALVSEIGDLSEDMRRAVVRLEGQLLQLDRRITALEERHLGQGGPPEDLDPGFDYEQFEAAFRGSPDRVREAQRAYLRFFAEPGAGPVLDLGCGEGLFLELLREAGVDARGVDRSAGAAQRARDVGLNVDCGDLLETLGACPDGSLGGVVCLQVVEHLSLPTTLHLIRTAKQKLRPGGVLLLETVNLASLIVFARAWSIDPTHRQALHPLTLRFLVEQAGFEGAELLYSGEAEAHLEVPGEDGLQQRNATLLNEILFGPQDYAVIARA